MADNAQWQPHLADAPDILHWSERVEARTEFPRLVRRLIQETNDQVVRIEMRAAEGAGVPGFDGIVEATRATPFVPDGLSCWELGVSADPQKKANSDYRKRTDELRSTGQSEATFVFVTSRRWAGKSSWESEKRAEARWHDVRAFDVDDIEQALDLAPAVHLWFSEIVGKPARGAQSLEDWWNQFASRSIPPLTPSLVLTGREDSQAELIRLFAQDRQFTTVGAASVDDDLAFIAASILTADEDLRTRFLARTIIVRHAGFLRRLDGSSHLLVLVPFDDPIGRDAQSIRGHHVVFLADEDSPADIALPPIQQRGFIQQLTDSGIAKEDAERLAQAAHRSLRKFQRIASAAGSIQIEEWARQLRSKIVRRAWLAGGWNASSSGDIDVMSTLFGMPYQDVGDELWQAGRGADPLFTHVGGVWRVTSPEDSWDYVSRLVNPSDLQAVETAVQSVLAAVDPALDLPVEDRWMAGIYGKSRIHSSTLREGLATTLALLGSLGDTVALSSGATGSVWAARLVFSLLERANKDSSGDLWSSLSDVLPLLAEAAPDVFLREVQAGSRGSGPLLRKLFVDQHDGFSVSSPHTGLLWALETLAWSGTHLGMATECLARLSEVDPGGRLSNRPSQTLVDIFRPWLPQTSANMASRLAVLKKLVARHPVVGWSLLLGLLPERSAWGTGTCTPRFRHWKPKVEGVTPQEYWEFSSAVANEILEIASGWPLRWTEIASRLSDFPPPQRIAAYSQLQELSGQLLPDEVRTAIWHEFNAQLRRHRTFPDAAWVLPSVELDRLDQTIGAFKPSNPVDQYRWLFDKHYPDIGVGKRDDHDAYDLEVARLRTAALGEVLDQGGLSAVLRLVSEVAEAWLVGVSLAETSGRVDPNDIIRLLDSEESHYVNFSFGYVVKSSQGRLAWILPFTDEMIGRPRAQARLLAASDELVPAWDAVKRLGQAVDATYWKEFRTGGRGGDFALVNDTARKLMEHGRPAASIGLLALYRDQSNDPVNPQTVVDGFEMLLSQEDEEIRLLSSWEVERLLEFLRRSSMDDDTLALLEWKLLPVTGAEDGTPILQRRLARDPAFFVEILSLAFNPASGENERESTPQVAANAFRLLQDWHQIPGSDEPGGEVDEGQLEDWMSEVQRLLSEADRVTVGEIYIGQVFAHAPIDKDGSWPPLAVRNVIEEYASIHLENGIHTGTNNKRGVTSRGLDEGGKQVYELAKDNERWADAVADQWPQTAAILRSIAEGFRAEGRTHDDEARRLREGIDR